LVQHLFQTEVPEIYDRNVQVKSIAREAGRTDQDRGPSREKDVDPVGACVGMKGTRVQSIIRELAVRRSTSFNGRTTRLIRNDSISPAKNQPRFDRGQNDKIMEWL